MKYLSIIVLALALAACTSGKSAFKLPSVVDTKDDKITLGKIDAQVEALVKVTGNKMTSISIDYYPSDDSVCLQYRYSFITYYLFFNLAGRDAYLKALEKYKEDFESQKLKSKGDMGTRRKYGRIECFLMWQAAAFTVLANANTNVELGYNVKKVSNNSAAFFTICQRETDYINKVAEQDIKSVPAIMIYLTRAKADEIAAFFDQKLLDSAISNQFNSGSKPSIYNEPY